VTLINDLKLYDRIFYIPPALSATLSAEPQRADLSLVAAGILNGLLSSPPSLGLPPLHPLLASAHTAPAAGASSLARLYLAAALTPYHGMTYTDAKGKTHPATEAVLRDGLKLGTQNHYLDGIPALFAATELLQHPDATKNRVTIGTYSVATFQDRHLHNARLAAAREERA
jgi:tRNA nucleotidyltransferase (CCA-adding enzyme)